MTNANAFDSVLPERNGRQKVYGSSLSRISIEGKQTLVRGVERWTGRETKDKQLNEMLGRSLVLKSSNLLLATFQELILHIQTDCECESATGRENEAYKHPPGTTEVQ